MVERARTEPSDGVTLVRRMAAGDRDALARFYDRYAPLAYALALRIVREAAPAAGVLEAAFWDAWRGAAGYDPARGTPEAWVVLRARARALDWMRSARQRGAPLPAPPAAALAAGDGPEAVERFSDRGVLTRALQKLPESQREVVELAFYGGLTQTEIARNLKQPVGTVKTRLRLGLERLRDTARIMR